MHLEYLIKAYTRDRKPIYYCISDPDPETGSDSKTVAYDLTEEQEQTLVQRFAAGEPLPSVYTAIKLAYCIYGHTLYSREMED